LSPGGVPLGPGGVPLGTGGVVVGPDGVPVGFGGVPAPPPGPGVAPPFAAPPRDQDRRRLWWGLGIGAVVLVLACVGGVVGFGLLASGSEDLVRSQAMSTVRSYLGDVRAADYSSAYDLLCGDITSGLSESGFASRMGDDRLVNYTVNSASIDTRISVDTTLHFAGGSSRDQVYPLAQSSSGLKICGGV